jgi:hypothetical protein
MVVSEFWNGDGVTVLPNNAVNQVVDRGHRGAVSTGRSQMYVGRSHRLSYGWLRIL